MSQNGTNPVTPAITLSKALEETIQRAVAEAVTAVQPKERDLLDPEGLAAKLKVPVSWVYEQSRQGKIPCHRIGKYLRFDLEEVIDSQRSQNKK